MNDIKERTQSLCQILKTSKLMHGFIWKEKKGKLYILLKVLIALINAVTSVLYAVIPGLIINQLINYQGINILIMYVGILTLTPLLTHLINRLFRLCMFKLYNEIRLNLRINFFDYTLSMDYETLEKPDIQRLKKRAESTLQNVFGYVDIVAEFFHQLSA